MKSRNHEIEQYWFRFSWTVCVFLSVLMVSNLILWNFSNIHVLLLNAKVSVAILIPSGLQAIGGMLYLRYWYRSN